MFNCALCFFCSFQSFLADLHAICCKGEQRHLCTYLWKIIQRVEFGPVLRWREVMKEHYAKTGQLQWWRRGGEWPCSSMGVDEMNKVWWNETRFSQNLESLFHWQFWAHIGSWAMLWRRAMIMVGNASWWNKFYCKPKGVLCLTGDDLLRWSGAPEKITGCVADRLGFGAPFRKRRLSTASKPHLQHLIGSSIQCFRIYPIQWGAGVQSSTASLVHQCSSPSQVDFRAVLVETYLRLRLLCGTDAAKVTIKMPPKCFTQKGVSPKRGSFKGHYVVVFFCLLW